MNESCIVSLLIVKLSRITGESKPIHTYVHEYSMYMYGKAIGVGESLPASVGIGDYAD